MKVIGRQYVAVACVGAAAFWIPSMMLHAVWPGGGNSLLARVSTVVLPATTILTFNLIVLGVRTTLTPVRVALTMLAGIWLLGSGPLAVDATLGGGGFHRGIVSGLVMVLLGFLPPYLFMGSTYDGTLGGLLIASVALAVVWVLFRRCENSRVSA